jgi:predicted regulator of Ras-like GTPase activity (Roadblock/LC7/MglB family)
VPGARAALLVDGTGEVVLDSGARDEHRLVGAYQGIALNDARRASTRHDVGSVHELCWRYSGGFVLLRPLKDGYFLVLVLGPGASIALGHHFLRPAQERMTQEL